MKCEIPSFVADFVAVDSWVDNSGEQYYLKSDDVGKQISQCFSSY